MRLRRGTIAIVVLLLLVGATCLLWDPLDWPPPRLLLRHGLPPAGGPTGRTRTIGGIEFLELGPGYFRMGSHYLCEPGDSLGRISAILGLEWGRPPRHGREFSLGGASTATTAQRECPTHWAVLSRTFWIARHEVTNEQHERFEPEHQRGPWSFGDLHPVVNLDCEDAERFCEWLAGESGVPIRLPSEVEWEFACRAGSGAEYCFGDDEVLLREYAWFSGSSPGAVQEVGTRRANAWGLHDMHGGVFEWCADFWRGSYEEDAEDEGGLRYRYPDERTFRGGAWISPAADCRSAARSYSPRGVGSGWTGFRPAFTLPE